MEPQRNCQYTFVLIGFFNNNVCGFVHVVSKVNTLTAYISLMLYIYTFTLFMFAIFVYFCSCHDFGGFWCLSDFCTRQLLFTVVHPGMCNQILSGVQDAGIHAIMINCILFTVCTCKIWYTCRFCWCQRKRGKERFVFTNVCVFVGAERLARSGPGWWKGSRDDLGIHWVFWFLMDWCISIP